MLVILDEHEMPQLSFRVDGVPSRRPVYDPEIPIATRCANRVKARRLQGWIDARTWTVKGPAFLRALEFRGRALLLREEKRGVDILRDAQRVSMQRATARPGSR